MPIKNYFLWVGGVLLCLMFALDAYLPRAEPHKDYDFDRTGLKITAPDTGIAPDTGAVAIGGAQDEASDSQNETKVAPAAAAQAFARLDPGPPKRPQRKRSARLQSAKPANGRAVEPPVWSSQWSYNLSSQWSYNWSASPGLRGSITDASRSSLKRQVSKERAGYPRNGNRNINFAGAGRNDSCWGC
jgi:hypothetical protein